MTRKSYAQRQQDADDAWSDGEALPAVDWRAKAKQYGPFYPPHLPRPRSAEQKARDAKLDEALKPVLAQIDRLQMAFRR